MTAIIKFTALHGAHNDRPLCYLLAVDGFSLLLDCGWDERFEEDDLALLRLHAGGIDACLLSHPDLAHLGALPYARAQLGLTCPVYATRPVIQMGQVGWSHPLGALVLCNRPSQAWCTGFAPCPACALHRLSCASVTHNPSILHCLSYASDHTRSQHTALTSTRWNPNNTKPFGTQN